MRVTDLVCGKRFYLDEAARHDEYNGWLYFFCSDRCLRLFEVSPDQFTVKPVPAGASTATMETV